MFFPFRVPTPVTRGFLCLGPSWSRSSIPSLAPSWWSPCPLWQRALLTLSCYVLSVLSAFSLHRSRLSIPFALSPLLRRVFADDIRPLRVVALAAEASPHALGSVGAHGVSGGSTYIALHWTCPSPWSWRTPLGAQVGVNYFYLRDFPQVFMVTVSSVKLIYACPSLKCCVWLCCLDTCHAELLGCLQVPSSHFQDSVDSSDWWSR